MYLDEKVLWRNALKVALTFLLFAPCWTSMKLKKKKPPRNAYKWAFSKIDLTHPLSRPSPLGYNRANLLTYNNLRKIREKFFPVWAYHQLGYEICVKPLSFQLDNLYRKLFLSIFSTCVGFPRVIFFYYNIFHCALCVVSGCCEI